MCLIEEIAKLHKTSFLGFLLCVQPTAKKKEGVLIMLNPTVAHSKFLGQGG
jgi:hypothetical protein